MRTLVWHRMLSALALTVIYAVCFTLIKAGLAYAPPLWFGGLRGLIGGGVLIAVAATRGEPPVPDLRSWPALLGLALTSTTITFGGMFLSPGRTGASIASVLGNAQPLFAVILAAVFLRERVTRGKAAALTLGLIGVTLISYPALASGAVFSVAGAALALAASGGSAAGSVLVKRMRPHSLVATAGWQLLIGSLPLLAASTVVERGIQVNWNWVFMALLLSLALVGTSFATALWYWLLERTEVGRLTLFLFLTPVLGLGLAVVVFGERVGVLEGLGIAVIIAGIGIAVRDDRRHVPA
jgi:O-acetylserine/cysteine efflux transporter